MFLLQRAEYATGYYSDQEKKCLGIQPDLTQNAGIGGANNRPPASAYCEYTYSEPTTSGCGSASKSGALTPVRICFLQIFFNWICTNVISP
jgi:hypothetical protein